MWFPPRGSPNTLETGSKKKQNYYNFFQSVHTDAKLGYDNAYCYAIRITALQFSDKPYNDTTNIAQSCNCEFAAIAQTVQDSTKVNWI